MNVIQLLNAIRTKRFCARLEFTLSQFDGGLIIEAEYFDSKIQLLFYVSDSTKRIKTGRLKITNDKNQPINEMEINTSRLSSAIKTISLVITEYISSKPFTIVKHHRGEYKLLDPNGMDYIGQYVTLKDAQKTSCHNYQL